ncbi:hypothetical protein H6P81_018988 [Aristolochia fimbriata]|uniref:IST1-like protein n=1 Tax=Aristolochia fimbriata TaxID=158543 RepID=A0AAV7E2T7_ARIFI|nr:hypothetical protein H6P81_018988 [Aristolochia fimbriata]
MAHLNRSASHWKKLAAATAMFFKSFNSSKCKTAAKMATSRIKLLRNKRQTLVMQMRRDVAMLLESGQEATARIRVEHVIREQNIMAAYEIVELFCELLVVRLPIIAKQRACPADLKEGISSLIFAAPRCSDIPELTQIRDIFEKKYGKDFVTAASELRPDCGVNRTLIERLSVRTPTGEMKLKVLKEIAKEYKVEWDTAESEKELLMPPEEVLEGPRTFVSATSMPVKTTSSNVLGQSELNNKGTHGMPYVDTAAAAQAAAESAQQAIIAAQAAAYLAQQKSLHTANKFDGFTNSVSATHFSGNNAHPFSSDSMPIGTGNYQPKDTFPTNSGDNPSPHSGNYQSNSGDKNIHGQKRSNMPRVRSDIKFDDSDGLDSDSEEEIEMGRPPNDDIQQPPQRPPPRVPEDKSPDSSGSFKHYPGSRVHPRLPDYDTLSARFEALKYGKP